MKLYGVLGVSVPTLLLLTLSACGGKQQNAIAKVGESVIDRETYIRRVEEMPTPVLVSGNQAVTAPAGYTALTRLIREQVLLEWAKAEGVLPTEQQVEERVQREMQNNPQLKQAVSEQRLTLDDLRRQVRVGLAEFNLRTKGVTVTEEEIKQAYEQNKQQFYSPATVRARVVRVRNAEIRKQIDDDLKRGFNFQSIVTKYSQNPVAGVESGEAEYPLEGAIDTGTPQGQAIARIREVLKNARPLQVTDWVSLGDGSVARFEVLAKSAGRQRPLEEVRDTIRERLMLIKGQQTNRDFELELGKRILNTPVEIYSEPWKKQYAQEMDNLKKAIEQFEKARGTPAGQTAPQPQASAPAAPQKR